MYGDAVELVAAVIVGPVLANRTAISSIRATPESALRLAGLNEVEMRSGIAAPYNTDR